MSSAREWYEEPAFFIPSGDPPPRRRNSTSGSDWIWFSTRIAIYLRDGERCLACGATERLSLDHVIPKTAGGSNSPDNLVTLCMSCNRDRWMRPVAEWRPDLVRVVRRQLRLPLDRAAARIRAAQLRPNRIEANRIASMERRRALRSVPF